MSEGTAYWCAACDSEFTLAGADADTGEAKPAFCPYCGAIAPEEAMFPYD